jgi:hypothetical protein
MIRHSQEMRPSRWCAGPLAVALVLAAGQVNAAFERFNPRFGLYDVKICGKLVGEFNIEYHRIEYHRDLGTRPTFTAYAKGYYPLLKEGVELRWVQLVSTTHPVHTDAQPNTPYFYPGERDPLGDGDPFYWNTSVRTRSGSLRDEYFYRTHRSGPVQRDDYAEYRLWFYCGPFFRGDELPGDKPYTWKAELSLVCWEKGSKKFGVLGTVTYGFEQDQPFRPSIISYEILRNPVWLTQERLNQYFDGWTMVDACEACLVPEPVFLQMGALLGMSGLGVVASRRRAGRSGRNGTK